MKLSQAFVLLLAGAPPAVLSSPSPQDSTSQAPSTCTGAFQITSFIWFNSAHNLECPSTDDPQCLCCTGKDPSPPGYGPPDYVKFHILNSASGRSSYCWYQSPGSVPATGDPGYAGITKCSTGDQTFVFDFTPGPNNSKGGALSANLYVMDRALFCGDVHPTGSGAFDLTCTQDSGMNSTCVQTPALVSIPYSSNF